MENEGPDDLMSFCRAEMKQMVNIGWPIFVSFFCRMGMASEDSAFVGHIQQQATLSRWLGTGQRHLADTLVFTSTTYAFLWFFSSTDGLGPKEYLAAAGLSDMATNILIIPPLAFNQSLNALVSQAIGSGNLKMAGTWLQLSVFWLTVGYLPMLVSFFFVGDILKLLGFSEQLCDLASSYAKFNVFWPIPNGWYQCMRFYFQAQGITRPAMYNNIFFLGVNACLNWLLVFGGPFQWKGFGFIGAAISLSCSRSLQPLFYWLYMFKWRKEHVKTWPGVGVGLFKRSNLKEFMGMSAPQIGTLLVQAVIGQSTTLLIARLGKMAIAGSAACNTITMVFTGGIIAASSAVCGIRTGFWLGKGSPDNARRSSWLIIAASSAATVVIGLVVTIAGKPFMKVAVDDTDVQNLGVQLLMPTFLNIIASIAVNCGTGGTITSQGRTKLVTFLSFGFELPFSLGSVALCVLVFKCSLVFVYWIQALVQIFEAVVVCFIIARSDWNKYALEARARQQQGSEEASTSLANVLNEDEEGAVANS